MRSGFFLRIVWLALGLFQGAITQTVARSQTTMEPALTSARSLPDSPAELEKMRAQTEKDLNEQKQKVLAWTAITTSLHSAQRAVSEAAAPDASALGQLEMAVRTRDQSNVKARLYATLSGVESLYYDAYPSSTIYGSDTETAAFLSDWKRNVDSTIDKLNIWQYRQVANSNDPRATISLSPMDLDNLKKSTSIQSFASLKEALQKQLGDLTNQADAKLSNAKQQISANQASLDKIVDQQGKAKLEINQIAIYIGLPLFCFTVLMMLIVPILVQSLSKGTGSAEQVQAIFASGILVEVITVLLLTMTILILGLSGKIEGPVLGTLLGGISGYVLNRFRDKNNSQPPGQHT